MTYFDDIRSILAVQGLSPAAKLVFIYLYDRQGGNGHSWPSIATISRGCGGLARSTVVESLHSIEKAGLLKIERPGKPSIKESNHYSIDLTGMKIEPVQTPNQYEIQTSTGTKIRPELVRNSGPIRSLTNQQTNQKVIFDNSRKIYPGRKRGLSAEFDAFQKTVKDWRDVLPILETSVSAYITHCEHLTATGQFCPHHKDFCRWLRNRCWEIEYPDPLAGGQNEIGRASWRETV